MGKRASESQGKRSGQVSQRLPLGPAFPAITGITASKRRSAALLLLGAFCAVAVFIQPTDTAKTAATSRPPKAKADDVVTDYFGTKVVDPYRWMEAGSNDPTFMDLMKAENDYTVSVLALLAPSRDKLLRRIQELDNAVANVRSWQRAGDAIFYLETAPGATAPSLMVRQDNAEPRELLDPVQFDENGSHAAIDYFVPSNEGRYALAAVSLGGSENSTIHVIEVKTGRVLPDAITRTQYGSPSWRQDSQSFYYARLQRLSADAPPTAVYENQRTFLHVLGNDPDKDPAVFGAGVSSSVDVPKAGFTSVGVAPGSAYALASYTAGTTDPIAIYSTPGNEAQNAGAKWRLIASSQDLISTGADSPVAVHGSTLYLMVDKDAPNRKLIAVDLDHPDIAHARVLIAPSNRILLGVYAAQDGLYISSKTGVKFDLRRMSYFDYTKIEDITLPYDGTLSTIDANVLLPGVVFGLESWAQSPQVFAYDPQAKRVSNIGLVPKHPADLSDMEAREVEARSADGTAVPLSIVCQRNIVLDGSHPTLYEGYGAYGISFDPYFDPRVFAFVERGGVWGIVHVRGGGEYGETWHNAGRKETKQHTIDDMIAAAHYLIDNRYTSPAKLAVRGTSAGGIAVGGSIVQHPELFAAAIDNVGATDLLRFQTTQGGAANVPEFGDVTQPEGFKYLFAVSPYQHVVDGTKYPAVLGVTGVNDPRLPSWMVAKMIARLQAATASGRPVLLRVDFDAGHGLGSTRTQREKQIADEWSFILWQTGDPDFQPGSSNAR